MVAATRWSANCARDPATCSEYAALGLLGLGLRFRADDRSAERGQYIVLQRSPTRDRAVVQDSLDRLVKHALQIPLRQRRALQVFDRLDILRNLHRLLVLDGRHLSLPQLLSHFRVVSKI